MDPETTKTLLILRHAKSDWTTGVGDFDRPLTPRGRRDARAAGALLTRYDIDLVWCSAARRTLDTWSEADAGGARATFVDSRRSFYQAWADELIAGLRDLGDDIQTLVVVGHQPTVGELVATLAQPSALADQVARHYPTAGLATLTYHGPWRSFDLGSFRLERFETARDPGPAN
ncbi:MAG: histidine phosphatase family protein [Propionibacteriaceae bacterium]|nr:histidine phosphatase family protein [Propionibacteriaceae bacterium]